jgi:hypothetical protein
MKRVILVTSLMAIIASYEYDFKVKGGKMVCFLDYLPKNTHLIYGFTPIEVKTDDDIFQALAPLGFAEGGSKSEAKVETLDEPKRRVLLAVPAESMIGKKMLSRIGSISELKLRHNPEKPVQIEGIEKIAHRDHPEQYPASQLPTTDDNSLKNKIQPAEIMRVLQNEEKNKPKSGQSEGKIDPSPESQRPNSDLRTNPYKGPGTLTIRDLEGKLLSPSTVRPYSLYKLKIEKELESVEVCYQSNIEETTLVRLNYRYKETTDVLEMPTKNDTSALAEKLASIDQRLAETLQSYEELQRHESRLITTSEETLSRFMSIGQILLFCYLLVNWLLKLIVERSFHLKKVN